MSLIEKAIQRLTQLEAARSFELQGQETLEQQRELDVGEKVPVGESVSESAIDRGEKLRIGNEGDGIRLSSRSIAIDFSGLEKNGYLNPSNPRSQIAEEFRLIKRPIIKNVQNERRDNIGVHANLIMVTSALPGEGKSFTALNLALSIALELDHTVLLVDADVSKPSIHKLVGIEPQRGLMDVVRSGDNELAGVLLKTNIETLSILPAGMPHERATEFLSSDAMNLLLEEMANRYSDRIIIFDSPPLLLTTEARALAAHMGQVVLVVEAGRTTHAMVSQALAAIDICPIRLLLLNKSSGSAPGGYYGYGYGYGYGQHQATQQVSEAA